MAAITAFTSERGKKQFSGLFSEMFTVVATIDAASLAVQADATDTLAVPGLALGDIVLGFSADVDLAQLTVTCYVSAANTLTVLYANNKASGTVDLASATWRFVIARM
jgi:hypothetical protein